MVPVVMVPRITSCPPTHTVMSVLRPTRNRISGKNSEFTKFRLSDFSLYSLLALANCSCESCFAHKGLQHPNARKSLLHEGGHARQRPLNFVGLPLNQVVDVEDADRQNGQRQQRVERQLHVHHAA